VSTAIPPGIPGAASTAGVAGSAGAVDEGDDQSSGLVALRRGPGLGHQPAAARLYTSLLLLTVTLPEILLPELNLTSSIEKEEVQAEEYVIDSEPTEQLGQHEQPEHSGRLGRDRPKQKGLDNHREEIRRIESAIVNPKIETIQKRPPCPATAETIENIDLTWHHRAPRRN
jgi:hypothetical protein